MVVWRLLLAVTATLAFCGGAAPFAEGASPQHREESAKTPTSSSTPATHAPLVIAIPPTFTDYSYGWSYENTPAAAELEPNDKAEQAWATIAQTVFDGCLVIVGGLQAWLIFLQLKTYEGQRRIMGRQAYIMTEQTKLIRQQTEIAERQITSQGPFLGYDIYHLQITPENPPERTVLKDYRISLQWKNSGKDIATNVGYRMGPVFSAAVQVEAQTNEALGKAFADQILRLDDLPGHAFITSDGTVDLDQVLVMPDCLRALYRKEIRFFIWCVMRYGSRLRPTGWFAEVATYQEFVLERDPDTFGLIDKTGLSGVFRVAMTGYRYREGQDAQKEASVPTEGMANIP